MEPVLERVERYRSFADLDGILARSSAWATRSKQSKDFVRWLLSPDHRVRPSAAQALQHPWLRQLQRQEAGLSSEMLQSLASFATAAPMVQSCLYAIAARTDVPDADELGDAFLVTDVRGGGQVSLGELTEAIDTGKKKWRGPEINVRRLFDAMDMDRSGSISFTKFLAACLHGSFCSVDEILTAAFQALDERRCGVLATCHITRLLPWSDPRALQRLPHDRSFGVDDWVAYLGMNSRITVRATQPRTRRATVGGFFDRFFCGCQEEPVEYVMAPVERYMVLPSTHVSCH